MDECVIDVAVTFNRPDCDGVVGIAREAAVALGRKFTPPETDFETVRGDTDKAVRKRGCS